MQGAEPFLSVRGIRKSFGPVEVLHGVDLDLPAGSVTALLGENGAGKSTFVRILAGDHTADDGAIRIDGAPADLRSVQTARGAGIRLIAQEIADAPPLSVAENITLGATPSRWGFVDRGAMRRTARAALDALGADLDLSRPVGTLRLGERQIIEIARASVGRSRCIIFDEPTAALSDAETRRLFELIARMKAQGLAILYITHRLDEVFEIADRACVLRDGRVSLSAPVDELDQRAVVTAMVGRELQGGSAEAQAAATPGAPLMEVRGLTGDAFAGVDLDLTAGEIVGLYGKVGSGVPEFAAALFGADRPRAGTIAVEGQQVRFSHPAEAIALGIGFLPPERKSEGLLGVRSAAENLAAPDWGRLSKGGTISRKAERGAFARWHAAMGIRSRPDGGEPITRLSGGNQQKVMLGRWLQNGSRILLLVEPTRGVDVGAREEIYALLRGLAREGHGILIASSDYEDITHAADRAAVMVRGRITRQLARDEISVASLTSAAGGGLHG
ncbi:sugar ABC transporter ATP-binding protein [Wenxinia saemankumensis]|uniref:Monosaccharide ABC transporter ATP-binding protein, CUT2 family n=1 Tax=Wenxinia saemankumensis TaxID=1447782 RepID=A0A1M6B556_9RHOB|nr:sugar ABC transporter ATP-binding protein [Wenxinia saemankumensis]SHI43861.1 monosaccharide ABC transporter ATP-binding protein, CUT2 family [Wenxinia saemankumensis]